MQLLRLAGANPIPPLQAGEFINQVAPQLPIKPLVAIPEDLSLTYVVPRHFQPQLEGITIEYVPITNSEFRHFIHSLSNLMLEEQSQ